VPVPRPDHHSAGPAPGQEDEWARGPTSLEVTVRVRGGGERIAMAHVDAEHTLAQRGEDAAGDLPLEARRGRAGEHEKPGLRRSAPPAAAAGHRCPGAV